jgi:hypothetical protein
MDFSDAVTEELVDQSEKFEPISASNKSGSEGQITAKRSSEGMPPTHFRMERRGWRCALDSHGGHQGLGDRKVLEDEHFIRIHLIGMELTVVPKHQ